MNIRFSSALALLSASLVLSGAGCDLSTKISFRSPFQFGAAAPADPQAATLSLKLRAGMAAEIQPSYLGVEGSIADVFGSKNGVKTATVTAYEPGQNLALAWTGSATDGRALSGTIRAEGFGEAQAMFLPAFWPEGDAKLADNAVLWLSPRAYRELTTAGTTEWHPGIGGHALETVAAVMKSFNDASMRLFRQTTTATSTSPFTLTAAGEIPAFPMRVNGNIEHLQAIRATNWLADYLILKNPEDPLILKVSVNPVALGALEAFKALGVDPKAVGYEIVSLSEK